MLGCRQYRSMREIASVVRPPLHLVGARDKCILVSGEVDNGKCSGYDG